MSPMEHKAEPKAFESVDAWCACGRELTGDSWLPTGEAETVRCACGVTHHVRLWRELAQEPRALLTQAIG